MTALYAKVNSLGLLGMTAFSVKTEVDIANGMPAFDIVGLPDAAVLRQLMHIHRVFRGRLGRLTAILGQVRPAGFSPGV